MANYLASLRTYRHLAAKVETSEGGGKAMANYPQELAQDAVCQSHTGHMTGFLFLPARPLRLKTNERMNEFECQCTDIYFTVIRTAWSC